MGSGGRSHRNYTRNISQNSSATNPDDDCDNINIVTDLQNIQASLSNYKKGDYLKVDFGLLNTLIVEGDFGVCGYITSLNSPQLINCLNKGRIFNAVILDLDINTPYCRVRIIPHK